MTPRTVTELLDVPQPAWDLLAPVVDSSPVTIEVLPVEPDRAADTLLALQVTVGSVLGALAHRCGGLLVDHGWVRLLGGGSDRMPSLAEANGLSGVTPGTVQPDVLVVGHDVLGGQFAVDGGGLGIRAGEACYWAPDSLTWAGLDLGHGELVQAFLQGATTEFYASSRWPGWEDEVSDVDVDQGLSLWPPPFSVEGQDLATVSRRAVDLAELRSFYAEAVAQIDGRGD